MIPHGWKTGEVRWPVLMCAWLVAWGLVGPATLLAVPEVGEGESLRKTLDAPMLFVKRHSYKGIHIYDTYYKWGPGGGIYVLENPSDPPDRHRVRAVIDPKTPETLGEGIYSDPDISYDAKRILFCFKGKADGSTSIYEIGLDGHGLRRLTDPTPHCADYKGSHAGVHDVSPAYLPDGRIVFTSTRGHGLVPCANEGVDILHVMNADGSDIRAISVNNVNEFDPCVLPDGRILHGRWEYVDKTALTQQSLWTIFPDGTNETALFANNMVHPEALLDARPVPGSPHLVVAAFTPHNSPPRGAIGMVDFVEGKNAATACYNFENKQDPTYDRGNSCEPWPLSKDAVLFSGRPKDAKYNVIEIMDRSGRREVVYSDPTICCHSPMLIQARPTEPVIPDLVRGDSRTGAFCVLDIYEGLTGVRRGEVKWLRVIEETSRVSASPGGAFNQTFLVSAVLAFSAKNYLGVVPVEPDGSAYFEVPSGRALYLQALDEEGRLVQSMRTFVQAAPGVTRTCIGCHEHKLTSPANVGNRIALRGEPVRPKPESWGDGFIDYPSMVQPILDKHCVSCHGGTKNIAGRLDLTGGWTEYFSISYENLISRRKTQLTAHLISGIDCMNGTSRWSAQIFKPRSHGSATAPLAKLLVSGHQGRIPDLTRPERDLLMAWIDTNGLYHGTWNYTDHGCRLGTWPGTKNELVAVMHKAGCMTCHQQGKKLQFENDWFNLQRPELSRILRAPLAKGGDGYGLAMCRKRPVENQVPRVRILATGQYLHGDLPVEKFLGNAYEPPSDGGEPAVSFTSTEDEHYQAMLAIIRRGRLAALNRPRADMPTADVKPGAIRHLIPPRLPETMPDLVARADDDGVVTLSWARSSDTVGLAFELHRAGQSGFGPRDETLLGTTPLHRFVDDQAPAGRRHYALVAVAEEGRSRPSRAVVDVPTPAAPEAPTGLTAMPGPGEILLAWSPPADVRIRFNVYRATAGSDKLERLTKRPFLGETFTDAGLEAGIDYRYELRAVSRRGLESDGNPTVVSAALPQPKEPVFAASFEGKNKLVAQLVDGTTAQGKAHGDVRFTQGTLDLRSGGHVTFPHQPEFDLPGRLSVSCWVRLAKPGEIPVVLCCGAWNGNGWFLQKLGDKWRWYLGGVNCDGGKVPVGRWFHVAATYDGKHARVYQDGEQVASTPCAPALDPYPGPLFVGQYAPGPNKQFQVHGQIADVRIYRRALPVAEVAAMAKDDRWR